MKSRNATGLLTLGLVIAALLFLWQPWNPGEPSLKLGLDLQGGLRVTLQSDTANPLRDDLNAARNIVENRVNQFGVSEPLVQTSGNDRIVVELPGLTSDDQQRALDLIGQQAVLEFRLVSAAANSLPTELLTLADLEPAAFTGEIIQTASAQFQQGMGVPSGPVVVFEIRRDSVGDFGNFTGGNVGRRMAIVLDDTIVTAPTLQSRISDSGQITGIGSLDEASDIALVLRSGSLPISLHVEEVRSIGPTLGRDAIDAGILSAVVGGGAVILAVLLYYGPLFGGVLTFAIALAMLFILGILAALGAALTMPGLAGLVLTIGAAIDGNVISFERIREELRAGRGLKAAMKRGFGSSLSAIIDANVTTLLAALALYQYTTGPVRGFAITLAIGIVASVFANVVIVPYVLGLLTRKSHRSYMWKGFDVRGLKFVSLGKVVVPVLAVLALGLVAWIGVKGLSMSTDFTGGNNIQLEVPAAVTAADIRNSVDQLAVPGITGAGVTVVEAEAGTGAATRIVYVRTGIADTATGDAGELAGALARDLGGTVQSADFVGPAVGADLRRAAVMAVLVSLALILVYVAWRFWPNWIIALGSVISSAHDAAIALGALMLFNIEFSIPVMAALLFVVGYSLNDSVIIADRVRENLRTVRDMSYRDIVDLAVNQTLTRTIVTSGTTLLVALALLFFGGPVLYGFSVVLIVGIVAGTLSSIFILAPLIAWFKEWERKAKAPNAAKRARTA